VPRGDGSQGDGGGLIPVRVAIVGAGPAGFYACEELLKRDGFEVDLYDALPTPFGLVRSGVAPDHPKIKTITRRFEKTAQHPAFRFFGAIELGSDISREELFERYHAVVYAVGTRADNRLGIEGEGRPGSYAATEFVAWYNGHPDYADHGFDLTARRAVVVGNGNVAIDVARMLVLDPNELAKTDTADHAITALASARVEHVSLLGRRGPAQASFTNPELLELGELRHCDVIVDPAEVELDEHSARWLESEGGAIARKNVEILTEYSRRAPSGRPHRIELRFLRSPLEMLGGEDGGRLTGLRVVRNRIEPDQSGAPRAVATGEEEVIECGLVLRSIGYRGHPPPGVPFDERRGLIRNEGGRVTTEDGEPIPGEYTVGWIKRGASGVIGTNKKDAADTISKLVADAEAGRLNDPLNADGDAVDAWLRARVPRLVSWAGWKAIDKHEVSRGEPQGRPRVKLVRVPEMIAVAARQPVGGA
jgi:ferredoxin--NADP+ reductase